MAIDIKALQAGYQPVDLGFGTPQRKSAGGIGGFFGNVVSGITKPAAKFVNQGAIEGINLSDTIRMLLAEATDNQEAYRKANESAKQSAELYGNTGGLLNAGTITNAEESKKGEFTTGAKKIGGTTAQIGSLLVPAGGAGLAGKAGYGALSGGLYGGGQAFSENKDLGTAVQQALTGAAVGGTIGFGAGVAGKGIKAIRGGRPGSSIIGGVDDAIAPSALKTSSGAQRQALGNKSLASQYGTISKPVARQTNPIESVGTMADYGLFKPTEVERVAKAITGSDGILTKQVAKATGGAGEVSLTNIPKVLDDAMNVNGLVDTDAKSVVKVITAQLNKLKTEGNGANSALSVMKNLEKRIANLEGKGGNYRMPTPERLDQANVLRAVKDELEDQLYNVAGANSNVKGLLTPELRSELLAIAPNNKKWGSFVDDQVMKAKDVKTLRSLQAPFVRMGKVIDEGDINSMTFGGRAGNSFGGIGSRAVDLGESLVKKPLARTGGKVMRASGGGVSGGRLGAGVSGVESAFNRVPGLTGPRVGNALTRGATIGAVEGAIQEQPDSLESAVSQFSDQGLGQQTQPQPEQSPYSREQLLADIQRDPENMKSYVDYYQTIQELFTSPGQDPLTGTALKDSNNAKSGLQSIDLIEQTLTNDPSAAVKASIPNPFGIAGRVTGTGDYRAASDNVADVIGRLRSGGAINDDELATFRRLLPQAGDSPEAASYKINQIRSLLVPIANQVASGSTSSTLQDAVFNAQSQQGAYR